MGGNTGAIQGQNVEVAKRKKEIAGQGTQEVSGTTARPSQDLHLSFPGLGLVYTSALPHLSIPGSSSSSPGPLDKKRLSFCNLDLAAPSLLHI